MATGVLIFLVVVLVLLAIPIHLVFRIAWPDVAGNAVKVRWAFGLVRARIPIDELTRSMPVSEQISATSGRSYRKVRRKCNLLGGLQHKRFRQRAFRLFRDIWRAIHKRDVGLQVRIGLGDPADTGQLWAIIGPLAGVLATTRSVSINVEPEFQDSTFDLASNGRVRVVPLHLIILVITFFLSPPVWQGLRRMRSVTT